MKMKNIAGNEFGRLTANKPVGRNKKGDVLWECTCKCGGTHITAAYRLRAGLCQSCGCLHSETVAARNKSNAIHGLSGTRVYKAWCNMIHRCFDEKLPQWKDYGGRGIKPCKYIESSVLNVVATIGDCPPRMEIDRIDNKLGYHCGDCSECVTNGWKRNIHWATDKEQNQNTRRNVYVELNGVKHPVSEWIRITGFKPGVMYKWYHAGTIGAKIEQRLKDMEAQNQP